jgi:hypothetical protein
MKTFFFFKVSHLSLCVEYIEILKFYLNKKKEEGINDEIIKRKTTTN